MVPHIKCCVRVLAYWFETAVCLHKIIQSNLENSFYRKRLIGFENRFYSLNLNISNKFANNHSPPSVRFSGQSLMKRKKHFKKKFLEFFFGTAFAPSLSLNFLPRNRSIILIFIASVAVTLQNKYQQIFPFSFPNALIHAHFYRCMREVGAISRKIHQKNEKNSKYDEPLIHFPVFKCVYVASRHCVCSVLHVINRTSFLVYWLKWDGCLFKQRKKSSENLFEKLKKSFDRCSDGKEIILLAF